MKTDVAFTFEEPAAAAAAEIEMFAEAVAHGLLLHAPTPVRAADREVLVRLLRGGGAAALLRAVEAVRKVAMESDNRDTALAVFTNCLSSVARTWQTSDSPAALHHPMVSDHGLLERIGRGARGVRGCSRRT